MKRYNLTKNQKYEDHDEAHDKDMRWLVSLRLIIHISDSWEPEFMTIKSDTEQHSQFLQCLFELIQKTCAFVDLVLVKIPQRTMFWKLISTYKKRRSGSSKARWISVLKKILYSPSLFSPASYDNFLEFPSPIHPIFLMFKPNKGPFSPKRSKWSVKFKTFQEKLSSKKTWPSLILNHFS